MSLKGVAWIEIQAIYLIINKSVKNITRRVGRECYGEKTWAEYGVAQRRQYTVSPLHSFSVSKKRKHPMQLSSPTTYGGKVIYGALICYLAALGNVWQLRI